MVNIFNDKKIGRWTEYFDNGKRKNTGLYVDGLEHGKWYYWYKSGKKEKIGVYQNGKKDGLWKGYKLWDLYKEAQTPLKWQKELFNYSKKIKMEHGMHQN